MPLHPGDSRLSLFVGRVGRRHRPPLPPGDGPPRAPKRLEIFGVGPDWVQLTWSALGPGPIAVRAGDRTVELEADGGPGSLVVDGLPAGSSLDVVLAGAGIPGGRSLPVTTLTPPPGEELFRLATVSDVHVGSRSTGYFHTITEVPAPERWHPTRCLDAAVDELTDWGAQHLVVKGDLIDHSTRTNWSEVGEVLARLDIPIDVLPGNHEASKVPEVEPYAAAAAVGLSMVRDVAHLDRPGFRLILADTAREGTDSGDIARRAARIVAAAETDAPVLVCLHHQLMRFRFPTYLPPGIPGPQANAFLRDLGEANPRTLVTSGHTHRNRRRDVGPVTHTEVGSTKDFPGTWAGYQVFEGGIVQTVRRIGEPSCIRWTDHTRRAAAGVWAWWAPGTLPQRCFTKTW